MKTESKLKRFLINAQAVIVILAIAFGAFWFSGSSQSKGTGASQYPADFPTLTGMKTMDGEIYISNQPYDKQFAFLVDLETINPQAVTSDILEIFYWGRSKFGDEYKLCDGDGPNAASLCKVGSMTIVLLVESGDELAPYNAVAVFAMNQIQIDRLLYIANEGGFTIEQLDRFQKSIHQDLGILQQASQWTLHLPLQFNR